MFKKLKLPGIPSLSNGIKNILYTNRYQFFGCRPLLFLVLIGSNVNLLSCSSAEKTQKNIPAQSVMPSAEYEETDQATHKEFTSPKSARLEHSMEENETPNQTELTRNDQLTPDIPLLDWSDFYATIRPGIPDELSASLQLDSPEADDKNLYEGFRIQIYSGSSPSMADTVAKIFRTWSTQYISGYSPETYTFFKAPYYRVHAGDFHDRTKAYAVSQIIKREFPDAWVVYDRVVPWNVPADSVLIRFERKE